MLCGGSAAKSATLPIVLSQSDMLSLADDVAVTKRAIDAQDGPVVLVGHSYGGVVISSVGDDPKVVGLVYICAFAADSGVSVLSLIKTAPADAPASPDSAATGRLSVSYSSDSCRSEPVPRWLRSREAMRSTC